MNTDETPVSYFEEYRCGCVSEPTQDRATLPGYCPKHGAGSRRIHTDPAELQWRPLEPGEIIQEGDEIEFYDGRWAPQTKCTGQPNFSGNQFRTRRPLPSAPPDSGQADPQNEPRTCPYCDQPRQDTFENRWRFECGTSLQRIDGKTVKQGSECKLRVAYSKLLVDWCKQKERISQLEKGITEIKACTRIGWFMTDLGAKCSKLLNQ